MKSVLSALCLTCLCFLFGCGGPQPVSPPPSTPIVQSTDPAPPATTTYCPAGEYDMLDWATLDSDLASDYHLEGNANPLYTHMEKDKFYWIKGAEGYPWDIQLVDDKNIYLWVTEQDWSLPDTYKKSHNNKNMPFTPRCSPAGMPGTAVKSSDTTFEIVHGCTDKKVQNLGRMINEVWGPGKMNFGADIPDDTEALVVTYRYDCNRRYDRCKQREEFYLTKRYGLVKWDHARLRDGVYVEDNQTVFNRLVPGGPPVPDFPCD